MSDDTFFDKPKERREQVLMLDARHVYRKVTRKIYDFSPEQLADLTGIVWLHRGENQRFVGLVDQHIDSSLRAAHACFLDEDAPVKPCEPLDEFLRARDVLKKGVMPFVKALSDATAHDAAIGEFVAAENDPANAVECFRLSVGDAQKHRNECGEDLEDLTGFHENILAPLAAQSRDVIAALELSLKSALKLIAFCEVTAGARESASWNTIANRAKGATMPNLNGTVLKSVPILVAPRNLQDRYADFVAPITEQIETLAEQTQKLRNARDLLPPRLMNGEISV